MTIEQYLHTWPPSVRTRPLQKENPVPLPALVGFAGRKRSGKNAAAAALTGFQTVAFADPIRAGLLALDPIVDWDLPVESDFAGDYDGGPIRLSSIVASLGWERAKDSYAEIRRLLQNYGTEAVRKFDPDFWVRVAGERIAAHRAEGLPVVVTDVRFPNEVDAIRAAGGTVFRVTRTGCEQPNDTHSSETALDELDLPVIPNDGTLAQFQAAVRARVL